ncbi:hypothetical protein OROMI_006883 [Orobanche minor]
MVSLRGFVPVIVLLVVSFTINVKARDLGEIDSTLSEADVSNFPSLQDTMQETPETILDEASHDIGEEKLKRNTLCSLIGGCLPSKPKPKPKRN